MCSLTNICYFAVKFTEAGIAKVTEYLDPIIPHDHEKPNIRILWTCHVLIVAISFGIDKRQNSSSVCKFVCVSSAAVGRNSME